tara:strand:- start:5768 stop:6625 length:858 start_codon:yes stop_codon:yes gene_type:complete
MMAEKRKPIRFRRAKVYLENKQAAVKGLIYASAGTGKTWLAAGSPNPVVILTEKNGITSVAHSNPEAIVIEVTSADELFDVIVDAQDGHLDAEDDEGNSHKIPFETLIIDSLTEAQRLIKDRILKNANRDEMILKDWNTLANHMQRLVRAIRDLPCHVICTALQEDQYEDSTGTRYIKPQFEGKKTTQQISQYFNFVGWLFKKEGGTVSVSNGELIPRYLMLDGPNNVMCKPAHPVIGVIENPSISQILSDIQGSGESTQIQVVPAEIKKTTQNNTKPRRRRMAK